MTRKANPAELVRAAKRIDDGASDVAHVRRALLASARKPNWEGTAAESFRAKVKALASEVDDAVDQLRKMADDLRIGAAHLRGERVGHRIEAVGVIQRDPKPERPKSEWVGIGEAVPTIISESFTPGPRSSSSP